MLERLQVSNLALTGEACLSFERGMSCITGETGAGKSLLIDALELILGARADAQLVRRGCTRLEVEACFSPPTPQCRACLAQLGHEVGEQEQLIIRRSVGADGRSRARINERSASVAALRTLGAQLLSLHGQHAGVQLSAPPRQLQLLDACGQLQGQCRQLEEVHERYARARSALTALGGEQRELAQAYRGLRQVQEELDDLALAPGDYEELDAQLLRARRARQLQEAAAAVLGGEGPDPGELMGRTLAALRRAAGETEDGGELVQPALASLEQACAGLEEGRRRLREVLSALEGGDPEVLGQRLGRCQALARRLGVAPGELHLKRAELEAQRTRLHELRSQIAAATEQVRGLRADYEQAAAALSARRHAAAAEMARQVTGLLGELAMPGGRFEVALRYDEEQRPGPHGRDRVSFRFAANAGQEPLPLGEVASGGELSRLALAIEAVSASGRGIPTVVFDEVDTGISGRTATGVGQLLHALSRQVQVLTVTHLPQVAACADQHFAVSKEQHGTQARSCVELLDRAGRIAELARLMGGQVVTDATLQSATQLLERADGHG